MHTIQEVQFYIKKVLDAMYIVSLIKLSLREGNIAILVSITHNHGLTTGSILANFMPAVGYRVQMALQRCDLPIP